MLEMKHLCHLKIPFHVLKRCTQDFTNVIGKGGYGEVYKGVLCWANYENQYVAVKRLNVTLGQGKDEFHNEIKMLSHCRHKNVVALAGFCDDNNEMIIVYEYASHGSLDKYLSQPALLDELPWLRRLEICVGVASALEYLHNYVAINYRILHRDIKSGNILLDDNRNAKLSDFGLSRIGPANNQQDSMVMTNIAGTYGYVDPKYEETCILMKESDVYSFGVVLFEVLCGRLANKGQQQYQLAHIARICYENGELHKIIDHRIKDHIKPKVLSKVSSIAYQCLQLTREKRPTMVEVALQLRKAIKIQVDANKNDEVSVILKVSNHPARLPPSSGHWRSTSSFRNPKLFMIVLFISCLVVLISCLLFVVSGVKKSSSQPQSWWLHIKTINLEF